MKNFRKGRWIAAFLVLSLVLTGLMPATRTEAAKKAYTTYTNAKYGKAGRAGTIKGMKQMLEDDSLGYIYVKNTKTEKNFEIPSGNYEGKVLRINAPKSTVENKGHFRLVRLTDLGGNAWHEYADGNAISVTDPSAKIVIEEGASAKKVVFKASDAEVNLEVKGEVKKIGVSGENTVANIDVTGTTKEIVLDQPTTLTITGEAEKVELTVNEKAEGSVIETSVPVETTVNAKVDLSLKEGAEGSTVTKGNAEIEVEVKNETTEEIEISTEGSTETEKVESGSSSTEKDDSSSTGTTTGGSTGGYYPNIPNTPNTPSTPDTSTMVVTVEKLDEVNTTEENYAVSQANQNAVEVVKKSENSYAIRGKLGELSAFASTNDAQGMAKWIGLVVNTGEDDITTVAYNGALLDATEAEKAAEIGVGAGKFILWVKAEVIVNEAKTFTLGTEGKTDVTITVAFEDTTPAMEVTVSKLEKVNQTETGYEASQANQDAVEVVAGADGCSYTIQGNLDLLNEVSSTGENQTSAKWIGLVVNTGETNITTVKYNGTLLPSEEAEKAAEIGVEAGNFILWVKAEEIVNTAKTFTLETEGKKAVTITVNFVDNASPMTVTVEKLLKVNETESNYEVSQANQDAVTVAAGEEANSYVISGSLEQLNAFASTNNAQGTAKWIGLVVDTGETDITKVAYNGTNLDQEEADKANEIGVGAGKFILWLKAEDLSAEDRVFTLDTAGKTKVAVTIKFVDNTPAMTIGVEKLLTVNQTEEVTKLSQANQDMIEVVAGDEANQYLIKADFNALNVVTSSTIGKENGKWVAVVIDTKTDDITKVAYNGTNLDQEEADKANEIGVSAGKFILWLRVEDLMTEAKEFTLDMNGVAETTYTISFYNTAQ